MPRWIDAPAVDVPPGLQVAVGGRPLIARTLARRGIATADDARAFLDPAHYVPAEPFDLPDLEVAVDRLRLAIRRGERILVWGDFDADGQTATALLLDTLGALGAEVAFHVPGREEGHGLHEAGLERLIAGGARLILTCDTGTTAHAAVARAYDLGAEVIITDHHTPGAELPAARAVINPHRLPEGHALGTLAGVGVAYELARGLDAATAGRALDLVALGTVADVATLTGDNRYLVQRGLQELRHTGRVGLRAIYDAADLRPEGISEEHIGFVLGPRLNALGRLAHAARGVELLTTGDTTLAQTLVTEVEGLNARRQWLTNQITGAALGQIERDPALVRDHAALVLSHPTWPGGVVGIVAGRLAERFGKPAVLIAAPPGERARGSGRSVPGVDLIAALTDCAPLLDSFGGHRGAAGFAIQPDRIDEFRAALSRAVARRAEAVAEPVLTIDAYVELDDLTLDLVADMDRLAPFGPGNPPLVLAVRNVALTSEAIIGRTGEHRRLTVEDAKERAQTVFWWQGAGWPLPEGRFDLAVTVRANDYRGAAEVQVEWVDARLLEPAVAEIPAAPPVEIRDYRAAINPGALLRAVAGEGDVVVWAEGNGPAGVEAQSRVQLAPARRLVVWTAPPGPRELRAALELVEPEEVIWFAQDPGLDEPGALLQRLGAGIKHALRSREGVVNLEEAAAATAQRISTVRAGIEWLAAQGQVVVMDRGDVAWRLVQGGGEVDAEAARRARDRLQALLDETAAYRAHVRHAPATSLPLR